MQQGELTTVIVPAMNAEAFIADTLRSILAQTHRNLQVLVVDDGSTDGTPDVVRRFAHLDERVTLIRQDNAGVSEARNHGLRLARGHWIAPVDADDLWHPTKIARQIAAARPETGMVYTWSSIIDVDGRVLERRGCWSFAQGDVLPDLVVANFIGNASVPLVRRDCLEAIGGYDATLREGCEDYSMYMRIAERWPVALVPAFLVGYRTHRSSMSHHIDRMWRSHNEVIDNMRRRHPDLPAALFAWSKANAAFYLMLKCLRAGDWAGGGRCFARTMRNDPWTMTGLFSWHRLRRHLSRLWHGPAPQLFLGPDFNPDAVGDTRPNWLKRRRDRIRRNTPCVRPVMTAWTSRPDL